MRSFTCLIWSTYSVYINVSDFYLSSSLCGLSPCHVSPHQETPACPLQWPHQTPRPDTQTQQQQQQRKHTRKQVSGCKSLYSTGHTFGLSGQENNKLLITSDAKLINESQPITNFVFILVSSVDNFLGFYRFSEIWCLNLKIRDC